MNKVMVKVVLDNINSKTIVQYKGDLYLIKSRGNWKGQELLIDISNATKVVSLLYGIELAFKDELKEAVQFIKDNL